MLSSLAEGTYKTNNGLETGRGPEKGRNIANRTRGPRTLSTNFEVLPACRTRHDHGDLEDQREHSTTRKGLVGSQLAAGEKKKRRKESGPNRGRKSWKGKGVLLPRVPTGTTTVAIPYP